MTRLGSASRLATVHGLAVGASGCAILWTAGAAPLPIPAGMIIMLPAALLVGLVPRRWASALGAFLGLLFVIGFFTSPTGGSNLLGEAGPTVAIGQGILLVGALTALVAGLIAWSSGYRIHAAARQ